MPYHLSCGIDSTARRQITEAEAKIAELEAKLKTLEEICESFKRVKTELETYYGLRVP